MEVNHQKEDAMADDAAKRWVSPYWSSSPAGHPELPRVWVLNPGTAAAEVTVRWHEAVTGDVLEKETHTIDAGTIWLFVSGEPGGFGWLGISSDRPIVPWGTTPVSSGQDELGHETMDFYPAEELRIKKLFKSRVEAKTEGGRG